MGLTIFIAFLYIVYIVIEIFIVAFKITGLSKDKARFQVISLISSTGFTTKESELITQHNVRRKIAERIMFFKYFAGIVGAATLINVYATLTQNIQLFDVVLFIVLLTLILIIIRSRFLSNKVEQLIEKQLSKQSRINKRKLSSESFWISNDYGIVDVVLTGESKIVGKKIKDTSLKKNFIQVLQIDKGNSSIPFPNADYEFEACDKLIIYGNLKKIKLLILNKID